MSTMQKTQAHTHIYMTQELVWEVEQELSVDLCSTGAKRKWEEVGRMEDPDQEGMERILVLLGTGHPNGIRNRWRTRAKAKTDS